MKLNLGKRILMFLHWLMSILVCATLAVRAIFPEFMMRLYSGVETRLGPTKIRVVGIALLVIYVALSIAMGYLIFRRGKREDRGYISVDSSDAGRVRIAVSAIEQMVRQSVHSIDGITDMKIDIESEEDAIAIGVNASIQSGRHVPTITMNMQRAIRQFVEVNCGVAVRAVSISINAVSGQPEAPRHWWAGRGKTAAPAVQGFTPVPEPDPVEEEATETPAFEVTPEADHAPLEGTVTEAEPEAEAQEQEAPAYDFNKPYVSEFAKDLAAMKAREEAEARSASEAGEGPEFTDDEA